MYLTLPDSLTYLTCATLGGRETTDYRGMQFLLVLPDMPLKFFSDSKLLREVVLYVSIWQCSTSTFRYIPAHSWPGLFRSRLWLSPVQRFGNSHVQLLSAAGVFPRHFFSLGRWDGQWHRIHRLSLLASKWSLHERGTTCDQ